MNTTRYRSQTFHADLIAARYVACSVDRVYVVYDVDSSGRTIRETAVTRLDLPEDVADRCDELRGTAFNQVKL
ncbi:hypothetical protein EV128_12221 [Rhizobium azibense]|nr:hypothetical protein EV128_12221 [Rhizobium azibense]